jgi:hypothetical protein
MRIRNPAFVMTSCEMSMRLQSRSEMVRLTYSTAPSGLRSTRIFWRQVDIMLATMGQLSRRTVSMPLQSTWTWVGCHEILSVFRIRIHFDTDPDPAFFRLNTNQDPDPKIGKQCTAKNNYFFSDQKLQSTGTYP